MATRRNPEPIRRDERGQRGGRAIVSRREPEFYLEIEYHGGQEVATERRHVFNDDIRGTDGRIILEIYGPNYYREMNPRDDRFLFDVCGCDNFTEIGIRAGHSRYNEDKGYNENEEMMGVGKNAAELKKYTEEEIVYDEGESEDDYRFSQDVYEFSNEGRGRSRDEDDSLYKKNNEQRNLRSNTVGMRGEEEGCWSEKQQPELDLSKTSTKEIAQEVEPW